MNAELLELKEIVESAKVRVLRDPHQVISFRLFVVLGAKASDRMSEARWVAMTAPTPPQGVPIVTGARRNT